MLMRTAAGMGRVFACVFPTPLGVRCHPSKKASGSTSPYVLVDFTPVVLFLFLLAFAWAFDALAKPCPVRRRTVFRYVPIVRNLRTVEERNPPAALGGDPRDNLSLVIGRRL